MIEIYCQMVLQFEFNSQIGADLVSDGSYVFDLSLLYREGAKSPSDSWIVLSKKSNLSTITHKREIHGPGITRRLW